MQQSEMDISSFFDKWDDDDDNKTSATAKAVSGSFQGQVCSITQKGSKFTYKLFINGGAEQLEMVQDAMTDEGYIFVQVPGKVASADVLDVVSVEGCVAVTSKNDGRVNLNAQEVTRVTPWKDLVTKDKLAKEHVEMPDDDQKYGPPCLIYCDSVVPYATVPGLRRKVQPDHAELTWVSNKTFKEERRLSFQIVQRQWKTEDEFKAGPEPLSMQLKVWEDQCRQLGLTKDGDLKSWKALMAVHQIPFYALVRVNGEYSRGRPTISLSTMAVQQEHLPGRD